MNIRRQPDSPVLMKQLPTPPGNQNMVAEWLAIAALLITFFGYFAVKVWDIDFWWHIAAGRNILENGAIPSMDPFGVYDAANIWGQTVLKSQWLGQVLLYWVYRGFDVNGIIVFRAAVLILCLAIAYLRCRLSATASPFSLAITALAGMAILHHTGERPQLLSFLFLSLIFLLLDEFSRTSKRWLLYSIPLVILLWSNTHGGAVLGVAALGLFCIGYVLENYWTDRYFNTSQIKLMLMIVSLSVVSLVLTPNGFTTFKYLVFLENSPLRDRVSEYASPWALWPVTLYYWVFVGVVLASLPGLLNRTYLKQGIMVLALGMISLTGYRYIPLFVLLAAPYVAASLDRMLSRVRLPTVAVKLSVMVIALAFLGYGFKQERVFQHGVLEQNFPVGAVAFIKANKLGGRMFNSMNWGGYLIWNLPGRVTVFIDGRMLDPIRVAPYTHILWTTPDGQRFFEQADFDLALVPYGNVFTGERYPLVSYLQSHPDWRVVYRDSAGYLFARVRSGKP